MKVVNVDSINYHLIDGGYYADKDDIDEFDSIEMYTKDEVIAMLKELQDELKYTNLSGLWKANYAEGFNDSVATSVKKIQCRIDKLKETMR